MSLFYIVISILCVSLFTEQQLMYYLLKKQIYTLRVKVRVKVRLKLGSVLG